MIIASYILVLIYSPFQIAIEPRDNLTECTQDAASRIGESMKVTRWDNMGGSHPIPKVVAAFCAQGSTSLEK